MPNDGNPNAYDDEAYLASWEALKRALAAFYAAGGTRANLDDELPGLWEAATEE